MPNSNIPSDAKDLSINQTIVAYENRQKCNSIRKSKQLQFIAIAETFIGLLYQYAYECSILTTTYRVIVNPTMHLVNPIMHFYFLHNVNCIQMCEIFFLTNGYSLILSPFILVHYTSVKRI